MNIAKRTKLGDRPEYNDIISIEMEQHASFRNRPIADLSTDEGWMMIKFKFDQMFACLSTSEKVEHWAMFRDFLHKVLNIRREFIVTISDLESLSDHRFTMRAGGQNLRARQLSEIRMICKMLGIITLHDVDNFDLDADKLLSLLDYV